MGCASNSRSEGPAESYRQYLSACQAEDVLAASDIIQSPGSVVCPDNEVMSALPENAGFDLVSKNGQQYWIYEDGHWHWIASLPAPNDVVLAVNRLKYALSHRDIDQLHKISRNPVLAQFYGKTYDTFEREADLNDLYASMAFTQNIWYQLAEDKVIFEFPGWKVEFKWMEGSWFWVDFKRYG